MRLGRWLYHHDQYKPQTPVFQVKKAAVRLTAWLPDGVEPAIQILVGDNPDDPGAYWTDWRMNGAAITLGNPYATQLVIAQPGWYRVETDDLLTYGGPAFVWAEDEEGTLDDNAIPVHMIRPSCSGSTGTQPPIQDPIVLTCEELVNQIASSSLIPGQWYAVTNSSPLIDPGGQIVLLQAMASDRINRSGAFVSPNLTSAYAPWPVTVNETCQMLFLHDVRPARNNRIYSPITIGQWNYRATTAENIVQNSVFLQFDDDVIINGCRIERSIMSLSNAAYLEVSTFDRALFTSDRGITLSTHMKSAGIVTINGGVTLVNAVIDNNARVTIRHTLTPGMPAPPGIVSGVRFSNSAYVYIDTRTNARYATTVQFVTVTNAGRLVIDNGYAPLSRREFISRVSVDSGSVTLGGNNIEAIHADSLGTVVVWRDNPWQSTYVPEDRVSGIKSDTGGSAIVMLREPPIFYPIGIVPQRFERLHTSDYGQITIYSSMQDRLNVQGLVATNLGVISLPSTVRKDCSISNLSVNGGSFSAIANTWLGASQNNITVDNGFVSIGNTPYSYVNSTYVGSSALLYISEFDRGDISGLSVTSAAQARFYRSSGTFLGLSVTSGSTFEVNAYGARWGCSYASVASHSQLVLIGDGGFRPCSSSGLEVSGGGRLYVRHVSTNAGSVLDDVSCSGGSWTTIDLIPPGPNDIRVYGLYAHGWEKPRLITYTANYIGRRVDNM